MNINALQARGNQGKPFGRSPSRWISQNYAVRERYIYDLSRKLNIHPEVDVFATKSNRRCVRWWGPESPEVEDAFQTSWSQGVLLWVNPPCSKLPEVVD